MKICGFQKTTLLDYPQHVAATVFTGGCNFRCPFCHNAGLAMANIKLPDSNVDDNVFPEEEVFAHLKKRRNILDGVCITGGEPTLQPDLEEFIGRIRALGYKVKLDSNGYCPDILRKLLERGLLDYIAMDVKASKANYARAAGLDGGTGFSIERIEDSVALIKGSGIAYEFRTTAVKGLHTVEEFDDIARWLEGSEAYFIQSYKADGDILQGDGLGSFTTDELRRMRELASKYISHVELRGVE